MDMVELAQLWLPVLVSAVAVFFASAVIWMALPYHKADIRPLPDEKAFDDAIAGLDIKPGLYMFPNCQDTKDMKSDAFKERFRSGPWGTITIMGKAPNFGMNLLRTFIVYLVVSVFVAYLTGLALPAGAEYMRVFRIAGAAAVLGHCMGSLANDFFLGKPARFIVTSFIDGVIFALIVAGVFAAMWPEGALAGAMDSIPAQ